MLQECSSREFSYNEFSTGSEDIIPHWIWSVYMEASNKAQSVTKVFITEHLHERGEAVNGRRGTGANRRV
jgi:hypothetical protein